MSTAAMLAVALLLDAWLGEPERIWSRIPHPAVLMGRLVTWCDGALNRGEARRARGVLAVALLVAVAGTAGFALTLLPLSPVFQILAAAALLAQKSLVEHVFAVAAGLRVSLDEGRRAVARIVGRDTSGLDSTGVARGAIESAAENFSDGVVAPAFWFLIAGLPGMAIYKAVNTADSMIGYRTEEYRDFGWAAARLDDVLNWLPARLSALLIAGAHFDPSAWRVIRRDAGLHRSPNAGWPEAAMAAVLGVALSGPRSYAGQRRDYPFVNADGRHTLTDDDIDAAAAALWRTWSAVLAIAVLMAVA